MQYDPLIEILNVAENSVEYAGKSTAIRNLQIVLSADPSLSKELQRRMAAALRDGLPDAIDISPKVGCEKIAKGLEENKIVGSANMIAHAMKESWFAGFEEGRKYPLKDSK